MEQVENKDGGVIMKILNAVLWALAKVLVGAWLLRGIVVCVRAIWTGGA